MHIHIHIYACIYKYIEALDKKNDDCDALSNMIVIAQNCDKPTEIVTRYINQIIDTNPQHPFAKYVNSREELFEKFANQYSASA